MDKIIDGVAAISRRQFCHGDTIAEREALAFDPGMSTQWIQV